MITKPATSATDINHMHLNPPGSLGGTSLHERALEKAKNIVKNHQPQPIGRQAQKEIDEIIRETEKELKVLSDSS
jgi:hypothetical protein